MKILSLLISAIFFLTNGVFAYGPLSSGQRVQPAPLTASLPSAAGTIRNVIRPLNGKESKTVIFIQDVHLNAEAQINIGKAIESLLAKNQVGLIALEGSNGNIDLSDYKSFYDQKAVSQVADYLFENGRISGPIRMALQTRHSLPPIIGVDDETHHAANIEAYLQSTKFQAQSAKEIHNSKSKIQKEKNKVFNSELKAFDRTVEDYRAGHISFGDYISILAEDENATPAVDEFIRALEMERSIDFKKVEEERKNLIESLVKGMSNAEAARLMEMTAAFRTRHMSNVDFYSYLKAVAHKENIEWNQYPAVAAYVGYVLLSEKIDMDSLFADVEEMEKESYASRIRTAEEKSLVDQSKLLEFQSKLVRFELIPEEWNEYKTLGTRHSGLGTFEDFYRHAEIRNEKLAQNLFREMEKRNVQTAVLVASGFHAKGVTRHLTSRNAAVLDFVPRLTEVTDETGTAYLSAFTQEKTPLEKLVEGENLFVSPVSIDEPTRTGEGPILVAAQSALNNPSVTSLRRPLAHFNLVAALRFPGRLVRDGFNRLLVPFRGKGGKNRDITFVANEKGRMADVNVEDGPLASLVIDKNIILGGLATALVLTGISFFNPQFQLWSAVVWYLVPAMATAIVVHEFGHALSIRLRTGEWPSPSSEDGKIGVRPKDGSPLTVRDIASGPLTGLIGLAFIGLNQIVPVQPEILFTAVAAFSFTNLFSLIWGDGNELMMTLYPGRYEQVKAMIPSDDLGIEKDVSLDPDIFRNRVTRSPDDVLRIINNAGTEGVDLKVGGQFRGFDGAGSSLDLPLFQRLLALDNPVRLEDIPSTIAVASKMGIEIKIEASDDPLAIEYVAPEYGFTADNPKTVRVADVPQMLNKGQFSESVAFIFHRLFGLQGIRITLGEIDPIAAAGGMESSNVFMVSVIAAASMLSGANLTKADIFNLAVKFENDVLGNITGGQGHLAALLGGAYQHVWTSGLEHNKEFESEHGAYYGALSRPVLNDQQIANLPEHVALVQAGIQYREGGEKVVGRTADLTNRIWTVLLQVQDPAAFDLHAEKVGLTARYAKAWEENDYETIVQVLNRYVDIRNEITRRGLRLLVEAHFDGRNDLPKEIKDLARRMFVEDDPSGQFREIRDSGRGAPGINLYTHGPIQPLIDAARKEGIAIFPLGAGGPGANLMAVSAMGKKHLEEFFAKHELPDLSDMKKEISRVIREGGEFKGYIPFGASNQPLTVKGFEELGIEAPADPVDRLYDQKGNSGRLLKPGSSLILNELRLIGRRQLAAAAAWLGLGLGLLAGSAEKADAAVEKPANVPVAGVVNREDVSTGVNQILKTETLDLADSIDGRSRAVVSSVEDDFDAAVALIEDDFTRNYFKQIRDQYLKLDGAGDNFFTLLPDLADGQTLVTAYHLIPTDDPAVFQKDLRNFEKLLRKAKKDNRTSYHNVIAVLPIGISRADARLVEFVVSFFDDFTHIVREEDVPFAKDKQLRDYNAMLAQVDLDRGNELTAVHQLVNGTHSNGGLVTLAGFAPAFIAAGWLASVWTMILNMGKGIRRISTRMLAEMTAAIAA